MSERIEANTNPSPILDELRGEQPNPVERRLDRLTSGFRSGRVEQEGSGRPTLYLNSDWSAPTVPDEEAGKIVSRKLGSGLSVIRINGETGRPEVVG